MSEDSVYLHGGDEQDRTADLWNAIFLSNSLYSNFADRKHNVNLENST